MAAVARRVAAGRAAAVRVAGARAVFTPVLDRMAPGAAAADLLRPATPGRMDVRTLLLAATPTLWAERPPECGFAARAAAVLRVGGGAAECRDRAVGAGCLRPAFAGEDFAVAEGNSSSRVSTESSPPPQW